MSVLPKNWHTRYFEDADFHSDISFFEFPTLILFFHSIWSKFRFVPKHSKLSVLPKNWHTEYREDVISYSEVSNLNLENDDFYFDISFLKFQI